MSFCENVNCWASFLIAKWVDKNLASIEILKYFRKICHEKNLLWAGPNHASVPTAKEIHDDLKSCKNGHKSPGK